MFHKVYIACDAYKSQYSAQLLFLLWQMLYAIKRCVGKITARRAHMLICYCFGITKEDIIQDVQGNGKSTILERIAAAKQAGGCQCAVKNPAGK